MVAERSEPRVLVYSRDERWAWVYEEDSLRLASNDDFDSVEAALDSAAIAYPDVGYVEVVGGDDVEDPRATSLPRRMRVDARTGIVVALACIVLYYLFRRRSRNVAGHG
jgi:hypothetical protein